MTAFRRTRRGQSLVEMAIATPILLTLLVAAGDWGRVFYYAIEVSSASRAGAQYGSQNLTKAVDTTGIASAARNDAANLSGLTVSSSYFCTCSGSSATVTCGPTACTAPATLHSYVSVTTGYTFNSALQWPGLPTSTPLSSTSVMELQQ